MGYAKYVGRVGALAVALGIGAALVGTGPGTAWAQDEGGDPGSQSQDSTPPGETPGEPHHRKRRTRTPAVVAVIQDRRIRQVNRSLKPCQKRPERRA